MCQSIHDVTVYSPVSSFTDLPRVFGNVAADGLDSGNGIAPSGMLPYAFLLHTQIRCCQRLSVNSAF